MPALKKKKKKKRQTGKRVGDHTFIFSCSLFILLLFVSQLSVRILEKEKKSGHFFPPRLSCLFIFSQAIPPEVSVNEFTALPIMNL